jgi:hypothetical protein
MTSNNIYIIYNIILKTFVAGTSMGNVASTYSSLGMHHEALELKEKVLELFKRSLPDDHPDIGARVIVVLGPTATQT